MLYGRSVAALRNTKAMLLIRGGRPRHYKSVITLRQRDKCTIGGLRTRPLEAPTEARNSMERLSLLTTAFWDTSGELSQGTARSEDHPSTSAEGQKKIKNKYSSPVPAFKGRAAYLKALAEHPQNAKMVIRAPHIQTRVGGSEELIKVKQCETAPPRRTCTAAAARQGERPGLGLSCTNQATSQSDLIADVDAGSSALLVLFFSSFPLVQRLITDISGNPRKQRLLLPNQLPCNHSTTCHFTEVREKGSSVIHSQLC